jgi:myosin heavy subunit
MLQNDWEDVEDVGKIHKASRKLIAACQLKGAQVGITKVFLKYYHAERLMQLRQRKLEAATVINAWVRRFLAQCHVATLRMAKAKADAERRREEERAAAERKRQEQRKAWGLAHSGTSSVPPHFFSSFFSFLHIVVVCCSPCGARGC